jgi:hypothetical protein
VDRIETEVRSLAGARIEEAMIVDGVPVLIVTTMKGQRLQVEAWQDPEGNGPGFLSLGKVEL